MKYFFQANNREIDLALAREPYVTEIYRLNDYLFQSGEYNFLIISAKPEKTLGYTTMLKTYDVYTWMFIGISIVAVMLVMVVIEKVSSVWIERTSVSSIHLCK